MRDHHIGALALTDPYEPGKVVGIVTDRDIVLDVLAGGKPVDGQPIGSVSRAELAGVPVAATLRDAMVAMHRSGTRRLLLTGPDQEVVGLLSFDDLLQAVSRELDLLAGTVRLGLEHEFTRAREAAAGG